MEARFSPRVKDVISYSREEALRLGHDYMGVEHLLLGIIREGEGMAIKILKNLLTGQKVPDRIPSKFLMSKQIKHLVYSLSFKTTNRLKARINTCGHH